MVGLVGNINFKKAKFPSLDLVMTFSSFAKLNLG